MSKKHGKMNYVGSISIIDRGDAPAQAVIDRNTRSLAQRMADETKDELDKVMDRVDNIYDSYEMSTQTMFDNPRGSPNVEYIEDIKELEGIITDTVKKKKYQQQVTIFIVGFQDVCSQKMQLLQQVNQFFLDNSSTDDDEDIIAAEKPKIDLEECSIKVEESLTTAGELAKKLNDINQDIIEWLVNYAHTKASNKATSAMMSYDKGKKRLEKNLDTAKSDLITLGEKLLTLQTELEEKDEKFQQILKQLDTKTQEVIRYKTAADVAKKSAEDNESHTNVLQDEINKRDDKIRELRQKLSHLEISISETEFEKDRTLQKMDNTYTETQSLEEDAQQKIQALQNEVSAKNMAISDAERELQKLHKDQISNLETAHRKEIDELKAEHVDQLAKLTEQISRLQNELAESQQSAQQAFDEMDDLRAKFLALQLRESPEEEGVEDTESEGFILSPEIPSRPSSGKSIGDQSDEELQRQKKIVLVRNKDSRPSTKDTKSSRKSEKLAKPPSKSPSRTPKEKAGGKGGKEYADASQQDEGGDPQKATIEKSADPSRNATRQSKHLEVVSEGGDQEFPDSYELSDEQSWATVPANQSVGRFSQYRKLSSQRVKELEDQLGVTLTKTARKVNSLKGQFNEHKSKWESERKILIEQVEQAQKLQGEAEKEADAAMTQLEEFINEQEKLEDEEEAKRQEVNQTMSRPGSSRRKSSTAADDAGEAADDTKEEVEHPGETIREQSEQELTNLLQQTDDAKAQEQKSRASGAVSAPPAVEPDHTPHKIQHEPVTGKTEDEVRISSAKSRQSLRREFKSRLEETKHAVDDRRARSPGISVPSQKSIDDELIEDDDDLPLPDYVKADDGQLDEEDELDVGTSPPPDLKTSRSHSHVTSVSRKSMILAEHPVTQEYLKAYTGVHNFKEAITRVLLDKDQMSASQILQELDMLPFDMDTKVQPQLESMTENVYYVLNEISQVVNSILYNDREPVVSSLMMGMSRDPTQRTLLSESGFAYSATRGSSRMKDKVTSPGSDKNHYKDLQEQYEKLQGQLSEEAKLYEEKLKHNTVMMMEMQDTINELQRELTTLGKSRGRAHSEVASTTATSQPGESAVMFTRLDSDRNAKIMKKAVNEQKLDPQRYKEAVVQMDDYVNLPAQRLAHLVRKYVHHTRMKEIEENVQKSKSLNENVFHILDRMEALQNQRAKRWADKMDDMGMERLRLANTLMETLDDIEQESGLFLIKPMYSYRGREVKERYTGKVSRPFRPQRTGNLSPLRDTMSAYAPAPTPASNMRAVVRQQSKHDSNLTQDVPHQEPQRPLEGDQIGVMGSSVTYVGTPPQATWSMFDSQPKPYDTTALGNMSNTPRILELDINRMMIGQNTISAQIGATGLSNDRLVNASTNNLRSYMTVNRPVAGSTKPDRPLSGTRRVDSPASPSSPTTHSGNVKRVRMNDPSEFAGTSPLPPIGSGSRQGRQTPSRKDGKGRQSPGNNSEPPASPSGSSIRQTPPVVRETDIIISPIK